MGVAVAAVLTSIAGIPALAAQAYRIGPPASWVTPLPVPLDSPPPTGRVTYGYEVLLDDRQELLGPGGREQFRHIAYRLLDRQAVQDQSQIEIIFDPTYEQVTLHAVHVLRDGRRVDQLRPQRIRVSQRESEADYQIYDGSRSLTLLAEDVRVGDVVEYSYSRRGANPVFRGHYMTVEPLQESVPLRRLGFRLLWPRTRQLFVHNRATTLQPVIRPSGSYLEYQWQETNVEPRVLDSDLPSWYDPYPELQLSDFASWKDVAHWGDSLFAVATPPAELAAPLARIRATPGTAEDHARAALRWVQDEIRYLGVEIGVNSHQPYAPGVVLRRRYGDCKDKALLLITLLRQLGVTARPALVSTEYLAHVADFQPTAQVFDHAIVQAEIGNRVYWLDPTVLYQRGGLDGGTPTFGAALVLGGPSDSLTAIPAAAAARPLTEIRVALRLFGVDSAVTMTVDTRYRGRAADDVRTGIRSTSPAELRKRYEDYYADLYPSIQSTAAPTVQDDETENEVHTFEQYEIPEFWHESADSEGYVGTFEPIEVSRAIPGATAGRRTMPLDITFPSHIRYTIVATLDGGWNIRPHDETIETPGVRFTRAIHTNEHTLTLSYEYETLADHVDATAVAAHVAKVARARKLLAFSVTPPAATHTEEADSGGLNWPVLMIALFALCLSLLGVWWISRSPPPAWPRGPVPQPGDPSGLGGWLVFVGLGVVLGPIRVLTVMAQAAPAYRASTWARLTTPGGAAYDPLWAPTLLLELVMNIALVVFGVQLAWQFFTRRRWFPALFVVYASARAVLLILDAVLAHAIPALAGRSDTNDAKQLGTLLATGLWVAYMFQSRRVRSTFVTGAASPATRSPEPAGTV